MISYPEKTQAILCKIKFQNPVESWFSTLVYTYLHYALTIRESACLIVLQALNVMHNRIIRIMTICTFASSARELY